MTTFAYSTGDPDDLVGGATADMADIKGSFDDLETWLNGKNADETNLSTAILQKLGLNDGAQIGSGKSIIATSEARTNTAYGLLTTPDRVSSVVLPTDGLIIVGFMAEAQQSVASAASVGLFLGSNQVQSAPGPTSSLFPVEAGIGTDTALWKAIGTKGDGLVGTTSSDGANYAHVTTGQTVGVGGSAGDGAVCHIFAAAGTYDVSVQFKASSGSVTARNRKLWVWSRGF